MPSGIGIWGMVPMLIMSLLYLASIVLGFLLLLYLVRIARWYVRKNDIPWRLGKKKEGQGEEKTE